MKSGVSANQLWTQVPVASRTVSLGAGAAGTIKSIQRGTCTITGTELTNDATLSPAVVMANTEVRWLGTTLSVSAGSWATSYMIRLILQSTTAVRAERGHATNMATNLAIVSWEITEWY
jgi:hypothetical protein